MTATLPNVVIGPDAKAIPVLVIPPTGPPPGGGFWPSGDSEFEPPPQADSAIATARLAHKLFFKKDFI